MKKHDKPFYVSDILSSFVILFSFSTVASVFSLCVFVVRRCAMAQQISAVAIIVSILFVLFFAKLARHYELRDIERITGTGNEK